MYLFLLHRVTIKKSAFKYDFESPSFTKLYKLISIVIAELENFEEKVALERKYSYQLLIIHVR